MVAILLLMFGFYITYYPDHGKDDTVVFALLLLLISSPGGYLCGLAIGHLPKSLFLSPLWSEYLGNFIGWIIFVVVGYLQWFKLLPYLVGKLSGWSGNSSGNQVKTIKRLWIVVAFSVLMYGFYISPDPGSADTRIFRVLLLSISLPGGYLLELYRDRFQELWDIHLDFPFLPSSWHNYVLAFIFWSIFAAIGYLQWFKLLPYLGGKLTSWEWSSKSSSSQAREPASEPDRNDHDP